MIRAHPVFLFAKKTENLQSKSEVKKGKRYDSKDFVELVYVRLSYQQMYIKYDSFEVLCQ